MKLKKRYPLSNLKYKVLSIVFFILVLFLATIVILYGDSKNWFIVIFPILALSFFGYCGFGAFYTRIIIDDNIIRIYYFYWFRPRKITLLVKDIKDIYVETEGIKMNMIHFVSSNGEVCINGYIGGANYNKNIIKSIEIVEDINKLIK